MSRRVPPHLRKRNTRGPLAERFWERVRKGDGCWLWLGPRASNGYGDLMHRRKRVLAHRVAWMLSRGEVPDGLMVRHFVCANRACVNPDHLALGTHEDNMADRERDGHTARDERNGGAKLSREDVELLRKLHRENAVGAPTLGLWFNISTSQAQRVMAGESWT